MRDPGDRYSELSQKTADNLRTVALSLTIGKVSRLTLPEVESIVERVARLIPAGNVPGMILNGLARLPGRQIPRKTVKRDINLLFKGVEKTLDAAVYSTFFAGPAAVIWGYQNLIKLSGKNPDDAFPEGPWQFYLDYSMREDPARHSNETRGFDTSLSQRNIQLGAIDRIAAWVLAATDCLHQYEAMLANEWRERVYTQLLVEVTRQEADAAAYTRLYRRWEKQRPYGLDAEDATSNSYPAYRREQFDQFLTSQTRQLSPETRQVWTQRIRKAEAMELPAYQRQMSILAYLDPGLHSEERVPVPLDQIHVGVIHLGHYHLIPICVTGTDQPAKPQTVRAQVASLLMGQSSPPATLTPMAEMKRSAWPDLRQKLSPGLVHELDQLRTAPILLNFNAQPPRWPLAELRRSERGVGDHALTIFDTGATFVFDQSHIFFDGVWGAALAEIMTGAAQRWAIHLNSLGPLPFVKQPRFLKFDFQAQDLALIRAAPQITPEVTAETEMVDLQAMQKLRRLFKQRNDLLELTINDLLILYRAMHVATYRPASDLILELELLAQDPDCRQAALAALAAMDPASQLNPAIVIPVDGSHRTPRDRLYPLTFEVPLKELDLLDLHSQVIAALDAYHQTTGNRSLAYEHFDHLQRSYLRNLAGFGELSSRAKEMARLGESTSIGALKLLAHLPAPVQRLLDTVPGRFDVLNDLLKGREVFSNVGAVARSSTLTRFISAKDDNDKKTLVWGVLTDAEGVMRITLRDFRPHVKLMTACGHKELAARMTRHYLELYADGVNSFTRDLLRITMTSRETQFRKPVQNNE